ncbi:unnamed protein product [Albugo candida]|uniref:Uncharacterized protein n=1 Tax=Albugo candida TaxID=65357 RepID=A0A024GSA8_9STRA|nr:unnamed protein product [Albugo candida]|eukprot:CCI49808.1 unnamed protein product [Albugo candida]
MDNSIRNKLHEPQSNDSRAYYSPDKIRSLVQEKEKELHEINEFRIQSLENLSREKESENAILKQKLVKLQEDFQYNLKLLEGRDEELLEYDSTFTTLKKQLHCQTEEISELKAAMAELRSELTREKKNVKAKETEIQIRSKEFRLQLEEFNWGYEDKIKQLEKCLVQSRQENERLLDQKNEEIDAERREWKQSVDQLVRDQTVKHGNQLEECETKYSQLRSESIKAQSDCEVWKKRSKQLQDRVEELEMVVKKYEKDQKAISWQLDDLKFMKNAEIDELKKERIQVQQQKQAVLDEYEGRMADALDQLYTMENALEQQKKDHLNEMAREKQQMVEAQSRCQNKRTEESINSLKTQLQAEQERYVDKETELQRVRWELEEKVSMKEVEVKEITEQLNESNSSHGVAVQNLTEKLLNSERTQQRMQSRLEELLDQIKTHEGSIKKLQTQIEEEHEKEEELQQKLVAQNLSWERKLQDTEQESRIYQEARVRELQQANDNILKEKTTLQEQLCHTEIEIQRLQTELFTTQANQHVAETFAAPLKSSISRTDGKLFSFDSASTHNKWGSASQTLSPLWSGDLGPPTVSSVPNKLHSQEKHHIAMTEDGIGSNKSSDKNEMISNYIEENSRLKDMIREMKEAIREQVGKKARHREEIDAADQDHDQGALRSLVENNSLLQKEINMYKLQLSEANRTVVEKHVQIAELERQLSRQHIELRASPTQLKSLQSEVKSLKKSLVAANADIERLAVERIQLMELSNQLSAEARRHKEGSSDETTGLRAEFQNKNDYETLIEDLMQSLEECRQHNKILKKELRRMIKIQRQKLSSVHDFSQSLSNSVHENITSDAELSTTGRQDNRGQSGNHQSERNGTVNDLSIQSSSGNDTATTTINCVREPKVSDARVKLQQDIL